MAQLKLNWSYTAKQQRDEIFSYWNRRNKSTNYSKKLKIIIKQNTDILKIQPYLGKEILKTNTRVLVIKNFSLIYIIENKTINIISFWENHQNPETLQKFLGL